MMNIWCCYAQRHRTTNLMESWNWSFNSEIGKRPSILLFFETISGNIKHYENLLKSFYNNGESISKRRKKSIQNDIRINNILDDYKSGKISLENCLNELSRIACITL
ncbi:hypothetical protein PYW07_013497 [Mythimna separata]|uniref:Uncharacterized protein n=1 Tax=Mythimna separata TaxID=271217 RepID=A0AAD8DLP1_MYTSE|nr:hypothetical protein PYW07_013497 [Mythimna separata]